MRVTRALVLALVLLFVEIAPARGQAQSPFQFAQADPLAVSWADLESPAGVRVSVLNNTAEPRAIQVGVLDIYLKDADNADVAFDDAISIEVPPRLPGSGRADVSLRARKPLRLKPDTTFAGQLVVFDETMNVAIRRAVRIGAVRTEVVIPHVSKWAVTATRACPAFLSVCADKIQLENAVLPILTPTAGASSDFRQDRTIGYVSARRGGGAHIVSTGSADVLGGSGVGLGVVGLDRPGTYEGKINFSPDDAKSGTVDLTVEATDHVLWPSLALLMGFGLALIVQRVTGALLDYLALRQRIAQLNRDGMAQIATFTCAVEEQPYAAYESNLKTSLEVEVKDLEANCKVLNAWRWGKLIESDDYKKLLDRLTAHEAGVEALAKLPGKLDTLATARTKLQQDLVNVAVTPRGRARANGPKLMQNVAKLLDPAAASNGGAAMPLAELPALLDRIEKAESLTANWMTLQRQVCRLCHDATALIDANGASPYIDDIRRLRLRISQAWIELWSAESAAELLSFRTEATLESAARELSALRELVTPPVESRTATVTGESATLFSPIGWFQSQLAPTFARIFRPWTVEPPADPSARVTFYGRARAQWTTAVLTVGLLAALLAGLTALYFGKPFGTVEDYLSALTWGLSAKILADLVTSRLASYTTPPQRPRST